MINSARMSADKFKLLALIGLDAISSHAISEHSCLSSSACYLHEAPCSKSRLEIRLVIFSTQYLLNDQMRLFITTSGRVENLPSSFVLFAEFRARLILIKSHFNWYLVEKLISLFSSSDDVPTSFHWSSSSSASFSTTVCVWVDTVAVAFTTKPSLSHASDDFCWHLWRSVTADTWSEHL